MISIQRILSIVVLSVLVAGCGHEAEPVVEATGPKTDARPADSAKKTEPTSSKAVPARRTADTPLDVPTPPDSMDGIIASFKETRNAEEARRNIADVARRDGRAVDDATRLLSTSIDSDLAMLIATSLADAGTPKAIGALLNAFSRMPEDSELRTQIGDAITGTTNPACADVLLDAILSGSNLVEVVDIAQRALGNVADAKVLDEIEQAYYSAQDDSTKQALADAVRHAQGTNAIEALIRLSDPPEAARSEPMAVAACDTLGIIGTPEATAYLLERVASTPDGASDPAWESLTRVGNSESFQMILQAARGQERGTNVNARVAAIAAMGNFEPAQAASHLKEIIEAADSPLIKDAAEKSLSKLR